MDPPAPLLPCPVVATAVGITYFQLWIYYRHLKSVATTEYFEATNAAMVYVVVAIVVASLVRHLRRDAKRLQASFQELEATKDRLVQEEKLAAVGRLAGAIAHEVRNPVTMIVSALRLATDEAVDASKRDEWFGVASDEARRLETLTQDFLAYARQKEPDRQPILPLDGRRVRGGPRAGARVGDGRPALRRVPGGRDRARSTPSRSTARS